MTDAEAKPPAKKKKSHVKKMPDGRYKIQTGTLIVTFRVDDSYKLTFLSGVKSETAKAYRFASSDPALVQKIGRCFSEAAQFALNLKKESEDAAGTAKDD